MIHKRPAIKFWLTAALLLLVFTFQCSNETAAVVASCPDPLEGVAGELDNAAYRVKAVREKIEAGSTLILQLPGVMYPDLITQPPIVHAIVRGKKTTIDNGDMQGKCSSPSRTFYEVLIPLPDGLEQGQSAVIEVQGYRLPFRSTNLLKVNLLLSLSDGGPRTVLSTFNSQVRAGSSVSVFADIPSQAGSNERIPLRVSCVDRYGNPTVPTNRSYALEIDGERPVLPEVQVDDRGEALVEIGPLPPGVHRVSLIQGVKECGRAGPCLVSKKPPAFKLLWGDIHSHTGFSDAYTTATPSDAFAYAEKTAHLDFAAVTDHGEAIWGCSMTDEQWQAARRAVKDANKPPSFTALLGFEWTGSFPFHGKWPINLGHAHVLFPEDSGVPCRANTKECNSIEKLQNALAPTGALTIRHHSIAEWAPAVLSSKSWPNMPVIEIVSSHGSSECLDCPGAMPDRVTGNGHSVQDALMTGNRLGFVGGSDNHHARPGARIFPEQSNMILNAGGLTCVSAKSNTREDIFEALKARRCYATTSTRMILDFHIGNTPMGQVTPNEKKPRIQYDIHGADRLAKIQILRGNLDEKTFEIVYEIDSNKMDESGEWTDNQPPSRALYYLRVTQQDKQMAWSSPIWIDF